MIKPDPKPEPHTIWALFVVDEEGQHRNRMCRYWATKPTLRELGNYMALSWETDHNILKTVSLWQGEDTVIRHQTYRLEEIKEGEGV